MTNSTPSPIPPYDKFSFLLKLIFGLGVSIGVFYTGVQYALNASNFKVNRPAMPFNLAEFERLKIGMSLIQIEAILGRGVKTKQSQTSVTYRWENSNGSRIIGEFDNRDQLINFRQEGLK